VFAVYLLINVHNHIALALRPVWIFSLEASFVRFFYTQRTLGVGGGAVFERRESAAPGHQPVKPGRDLDPHPPDGTARPIRSPPRGRRLLRRRHLLRLLLRHPSPSRGVPLLLARGSPDVTSGKPLPSSSCPPP
jgi:hypothetical protein